MMLRAPYGRPQTARLVAVGLAFVATLAVGCTSTLLRPLKSDASLDELARDDDNLISQFTHPFGLTSVKVEAISLVTGLGGSGSDPPPTPQRAALLDELNHREVPNPNEVLASPDTAMVLLRGYLKPGIREGDRFDVEVHIPSHSDTTSLRNGWVLPARMTELAVLGRQIKKGHLLAVCEGPVLVDPSASSDEDAGYSTLGRLLSGGVATKDRPLGLVISAEHRSVRLAQAIESQINLRFHGYERGQKKGVATAKTDEFVELRVHERYSHNIGRYVRVIRSLAVNERSEELLARLDRLQTQLNDPLTAARAALRLEAIGNEQAIEILVEGAKSTDAEVSFYSAEALAYLDQTEAVEALAAAVRQEPAFRANSLAALSTMDDVVAYDALRSLLSVTSAETRYGAFRALWNMNAGDPLVVGERLDGQFGYHVLDVEGPDMVHVTRTFRPEVVLFGANQKFQLPMVLDAGSDILVNGLAGSDDEVTVSRFVVGETAEKRVVSTRVDDVVRAIVELGGAYPDVVQALHQAHEDGALPSRLLVDAIPEPGRRYNRESGDADLDPDDAGAAPYRLGTPLPDLFSRKK